MPWQCGQFFLKILHYNDVITTAMASQITDVSIVYSTVCSGADKINHSSASLVFLGNWPVISLHKGPVTRRMFPFGDIVLTLLLLLVLLRSDRLSRLRLELERLRHRLAARSSVHSRMNVWYSKLLKSLTGRLAQSFSNWGRKKLMVRRNIY